MLKNLMLKDFIDELGSSSPAPGGGSAAALSASLSSALTSMVFNLTIDKKVFNEYDDEKKLTIKEQLKSVSNLKFEFLEEMDRDSEAFLTLMDAFRLPKNTDEEKKIREQKIQEGYKAALEVPMKLAQKAYEVYEYVYTAAKWGNKNAVSDAGVAALLLQTAIESAILNVIINLAGIKDEKLKKQIEADCTSLKNEGERKKNEIMELVYGKIKA